jgi:hypothetical protein
MKPSAGKILGQRSSISAPKACLDISRGCPEANPGYAQKTSAETGSLTPMEAEELIGCETILERGLATFFEVGNALLLIREKCLYRATYKTFEQYCRERWNFGRSYAWRVMGAAERVNLLPNHAELPRPANEFQVRPFLKLAPAQFPAAWERAVGMAHTGNVPTNVARAVIEELHPSGNGNSSQRQKKSKVPIGQILVLLYQARRCVEKHQDEQAFEAIDRIEKLLCGPHG